MGSRPGGQNAPGRGSPEQTQGTVSPWEPGSGPACEEQQGVHRDRKELFLCLVGPLEVGLHLSGSAFADSSAAMVTGFGGAPGRSWAGESCPCSVCAEHLVFRWLVGRPAVGFGSCRVLFDAGRLSQDTRSPSFLSRCVLLSDAGVTACGRQGWSQAVGCSWAEFVLKQVKRKAGEKRLLALAVPS